MKKVLSIILLCLCFITPSLAETNDPMEDVLIIANQLEQIESATRMFKVNNERYPQDINELIKSGNSGIGYIKGVWNLRCFVDSCLLSQRNSVISKDVCAWLLSENAFWDFKDMGKCKPGSFSYKFQ